MHFANGDYPWTWVKLQHIWVWASRYSCHQLSCLGESRSSHVSLEHSTWLPLLAVVYCTSFVNRIRFMRGVPETNWSLYCLARHQRPASIRQQNSWKCLVDENSQPNLLCSFTGTCHDPALITQPMLASPELILEHTSYQAVRRWIWRKERADGVTEVLIRSEHG